MARYAIKSATLTFGSTTFDMESAPTGKSETREAVEVTALSDSVKQFIQGALKETDEISVTLYRKDTGDLTADSTPAALSISVTLEDGTGTSGDKTVSVSYAKAIVTKVEYPSTEASSDRKAVYTVTFRPDGSTGSTSQV